MFSEQPIGPPQGGTSRRRGRAMIRMAIEFIGGPLDGHYQQVTFPEQDSGSGPATTTECQRTVMAIVGKDKKLVEGQRVAIYRLQDRHGRWQYHFQGEMLYSNG
jgi:hypothetical protein